MAEKQFKDPIYGYIKVDKDMVENIIDTPAFQRLKDIRQTSYAPLYPSAHHNRYAHSLGVYYLGKLAFTTIKPQLEKRFKELKFSEAKARTNTKKLQRIFELACLLHDIGHAPFSHTGETFYLDEEKTLYRELEEAVGSEAFARDFDNLDTKKPAPHECMSGLVGLKAFPKYFSSEKERSLFARCIIGMPFQFSDAEPKWDPKGAADENKKRTEEYEGYIQKKGSVELTNCVISLLNSSIIDVDRLDYIIRDAETIGFQGVQIDYMRLLGGLWIVRYEGKLCIGYHKSALSVIESAVYAHDAERKWVQGHPAILYEMEALKNAMGSLTARFSWAEDKNPLFCYEALTEKGKELRYPIELFSKEAKELLAKKELFSEKAQAVEEKKSLFSDDWVFDKESGTLYEKHPVALLADEDFLSLMKRFCKDELGYEYFARNYRRLPVWKSEAEFSALFQAQIGAGSKLTKKMEEDFEGLMNYCQEKAGHPIVGEWIFQELEKEEKSAKTSLEEKTIPESVYGNMIKGIQAKRHWTRILKEVAGSLDIEFEFLILFQKKFNSSFNPSLWGIPIYFPNVKEEDGVLPLKSVITTLQSSSNEEPRSNFFHLFYKPKERIDGEKKKEIVQKIAAELIAGASVGYH